MINETQRPRVMMGLAGLVILILLLVMTITLPPGIDWRLTYRPATLALLRGGNPYALEVSPQAPFFAAPWGLLPLIPLALLPVEVGRALLLVISLAAFAYTAKKLGAGVVAMVAFLLSPPSHLKQPTALFSTCGCACLLHCSQSQLLRHREVLSGMYAMPDGQAGSLLSTARSC